MVRLVGLALLVGSLSAAGWSNPPAPQGPPTSQNPIVSLPADSAAQRSFALPGIATYSNDSSGGADTHAQIAPNARFGVGIFGLKSDRIHQFRATVREIDAPRTRRAGVGFSWKF